MTLYELHPVPSVLRRFLGLQDGVLMTRPKIMELFSNKLKKLGLLTNNKDYILDDYTAKQLKKEKGMVINFLNLPAFIRSIYENEKIKQYNIYQYNQKTN